MARRQGEILGTQSWWLHTWGGISSVTCSSWGLKLTARAHSVVQSLLNYVRSKNNRLGFEGFPVSPKAKESCQRQLMAAFSLLRQATVGQKQTMTCCGLVSKVHTCQVSFRPRLMSRSWRGTQAYKALCMNKERYQT